MPSREKPRERFLRLGAPALSTAELLAILLGSGLRGASALDLGQAIVARFGLGGLGKAGVEDLGRLPGLGPARALRIGAAVELGRRMASHAPVERRRIRAPADVAGMLSAEMAALEQEHLRVVMLNIRHEVLGVHEVYKGSLSASPVRVAEVFREPIRRNVASIIVVHNHPSGDPDPSPDDVRITRQLVEAGRLLDVEVLDHLVIAERGWASLRERSLGFGPSA
jgi:DNA repair protein RadC